MSRATALARGRVAAERGMLDTCRVERVTGTSTNTVNGVAVETTTVIYTGRCRLRPGAATQPGGQSTVGGQVVVLVGTEVAVPVGSAEYRPNDRVTITSAASDPTLVGNTYTIVSVPSGSEVTAMRLAVEAVQ